MTREVRLDGEKNGQIGFQTWSNRQNRTIRWLLDNMVILGRHGGTISMDLEAIWGMSDKASCGGRRSVIRSSECIHREGGAMMGRLS